MSRRLSYCLISPAKAAVLTLYNFSGTNYESADTDPGSTASTIAAGAGSLLRQV